ncbi:putative aldouronate transport system permease protein [Paenibacillus sp. 1_12]|uniref:ABC transporter permease n=1 Tax=Paenibacillus sp. 1_12 TaxID=1566278 RepID=UPI0008F3FE40|nr:ABC transporter permease subunit [Paenibacillus sp. 1_12]SFL01190.1 putative aldouronate transport system permease protein [Paenibacillus sp. 1_12]
MARIMPTNKRWARIKRNRYIYLLMSAGVIYFFLFKFLPIWGLLLSFQDYSPFKGFFGSSWVGFKHFSNLFQSEQFYMMGRNTFLISIFNLVFYFPVPIVLALMLNEVRHEWFKKINQSIVYLPHFLSWVILVSLTFFVFSSDIGIINKLVVASGNQPILFLSEPKFFWILLTLQNIWKDAGWGTIIFLAAIAGVDPARYEAAVIDGASRWRQIYHITLPAIRPTIIILLILRFGNMADVGFEQVLLMMNPLVTSVADVFDTYSYMQGIVGGKISVGIAVGMFKGIVGLILVVTANQIVKKLGYEGIY